MDPDEDGLVSFLCTPASLHFDPGYYSPVVTLNKGGDFNFIRLALGPGELYVYPIFL